MGRRLPPQLRASLLRPILQQRRPTPPSTAASPDHVARCFASAANAGAAAQTQSSPATPASRPPALSRGLFFPSTVTRRKDELCHNVISAAAFSSSSSSGSPHLVVVESAEDFESSVKKVQEGALPAIFYFSATWCGPCKLLAPVVNELSKMYPPCVTYKIDIDMEGIQDKLNELGISAVPTLNFYKDGKIAATVTGADVKKIKAIMDEFYK